MAQSHTATPDVRVDHDFSITSFTLLTEAARDWFDENVHAEGWQWFGGRLCIEARFTDAIVDGLLCDGLVVA